MSPRVESPSCVLEVGTRTPKTSSSFAEIWASTAPQLKVVVKHRSEGPGTVSGRARQGKGYACGVGMEAGWLTG